MKNFIIARDKWFLFEHRLIHLFLNIFTNLFEIYRFTSDESFFILQMKKYSQEFFDSLKFHEYIFTLVIS